MGVFVAENTNSAGENFGVFKVGSLIGGSSVLIPGSFLMWGADSASLVVTDTADPFPVRLYGNDTSNPVGVNQVGYVAPSTTVTVTNIASNDTVVTVTNPTDTTVTINSSATIAVTTIDPSGNAGALDGTNSAVRVSIVSGGDANDTTVTISNAVAVTSTNTIDSNNTSTSALSSGATFTGTGTDVSDYATVTIHVKADEPSAASGMTFQFSPDNSNWDDVYRFSFTDTAGARRFQFPVTAQYFRFVYTNGASAQSVFRAQTILHNSNVSQSIHRLGDTALTADRSVTTTKSAIVAQRGGTGNFIPVAATAAGNLNVNVAEVENDSTNPIFVSNDTVTPINTTYVGRQTVAADALSSAGGLQKMTLALSSLAQTVTSSVARLYGYHIGNPDTAANVFVKFYEDDSAGVTLGTSSAVMDLFIPFGGGAALAPTGPGIDMDSGISITAAGGGGSTDHTAPSTTLYATVWYKDVSG